MRRSFDSNSVWIKHATWFHFIGQYFVDLWCPYIFVDVVASNDRVSCKEDLEEDIFSTETCAFVLGHIQQVVIIIIDYFEHH